MSDDFFIRVTYKGVILSTKHKFEIYHDTTYSTAMIAEGHRSHLELTRYTPYLIHAGELKDVFCEYSTVLI